MALAFDACSLKAALDDPAYEMLVREAIKGKGWLIPEVSAPKVGIFGRRLFPSRVNRDLIIMRF